MKNRYLSIAFTTLLLLGALPAKATLMTTNYSGYINFDNGNPFGVEYGDLITGSVEYDDTGLTNASYETHALGALDLTSLGFIFPALSPMLIGTFSYNSLIGIVLNDIVFDSGIPYNFLMTGGPSFDIQNLAGISVLGGCLDFGTGVCSEPGYQPVPEPATLPLLSLGLFGFLVSRQRYRRVADPRL